MRAWINLVEGRRELDELQGVKEKPRVFDTQDDFVAWMEGQGFETLGDGVYGAVFTHPAFRGRYVLKVFSDTYYAEFIRIAQANPSPHFPRFVGKLVEVAPDAHMIRIEVLTPLSELTADRYLGSPRDWSRLNKMALAIADGMMAREDADLTGMSVPDVEGVFAALLIVYGQKPSGAALDLHDENVMLRGSTLVITDPYKGSARYPFLKHDHNRDSGPFGW